MRRAVAITLLFVLPVAVEARGPRSLTVTYRSVPAGAMLYQVDDSGVERLLGVTPFKVKYQPPKEFRDGKSCVRLRATTVRWISGAEASTGLLQACPQNGGNQQWTFDRPRGIEGAIIDIEFALRALIAGMEADVRRMDAANYADEIRRIRNQQRSLQCRSTFVGSSIITNCY